MQFIMYSIDDSNDDRSGQPSTAAAPMTNEQLAALGKLIEDSTRAGVLVTTGGAAARGTRVRSEGGKFSTTDGPFIEAKELTGGFAVIQAASLEDAIEWAKRFRAIIGDGESEIVRIYGPSDYPSQPAA